MRYFKGQPLVNVRVFGGCEKICSGYFWLELVNRRTGPQDYDFIPFENGFIPIENAKTVKLLLRQTFPICPPKKRSLSVQGPPD